MYKNMIASAISRTHAQIHYNHEVVSVAPSASGWGVTAWPRAEGDAARPDPLAVREYDEVILCVNAKVAARLLTSGGDGDVSRWPECSASNPGRVACRTGSDGVGRALRKWALDNTECVTAASLTPSPLPSSRLAPC